MIEGIQPHVFSEKFIRKDREIRRRKLDAALRKTRRSKFYIFKHAYTLVFYPKAYGYYLKLHASHTS